MDRCAALAGTMALDLPLKCGTVGSLHADRNALCGSWEKALVETADITPCTSKSTVGMGASQGVYYRRDVKEGARGAEGSYDGIYFPRRFASRCVLPSWLRGLDSVRRFYRS